MDATVGWEGATELERVWRRLWPRFARAEARGRCHRYLLGLLSRVERKNGWQLAEAAGEATPHGMQELLNRAVWDADAVGDDLRRYVVEHLGDPAGVLVVDETGFLKKGTKSAGVQRQSSGTAGRIENSQIGVFLAYATAVARTFLDRELYLPKAWTEDGERCAEAGIPTEVGFATKPELAMRMLTRALDAEVPAAWVTGDEVYGQQFKLRHLLEERGMPYVLAVPVNQRVFATIEGRVAELRADALAAGLSAQSFRKISAGVGAKGPRLYHWARAAVRPLEDTGMGYWLLVRRSLSEPSDLAYYLCFGPAGTPLRELVRVAGARWAIEESFQTAKGDVGLDQYQVRRWDGWYRHITLAMLAHAFLTVTRADADQKGGPTHLPATSSRSQSPRSDGYSHA